MAEDRAKLVWTDVALLAAVLLAAAALVALQIAVVPAFAAMYREFGGELPVITRLVLAAWLPLTAVVLTLALGAGGMVARLRGAGGVGIGLLVAGALLGVSAIGFCVYSLYAPLFALAGRIAP
jgi:hypothetical protein